MAAGVRDSVTFSLACCTTRSSAVTVRACEACAVVREFKEVPNRKSLAMKLSINSEILGCL